MNGVHRVRVGEIKAVLISWSIREGSSDVTGPRGWWPRETGSNLAEPGVITIWSKTRLKLFIELPLVETWFHRGWSFKINIVRLKSDSSRKDYFYHDIYLRPLFNVEAHWGQFLLIRRERKKFSHRSGEN